MKKIFLSPFFMPILFLVSWGIFLAIILFYFPEQKFAITKNGQILDILTYSGYGVLIISMFYFIRDYHTKQEKISWGIYLFLAICAVLREAGIQHHLSSTDTTPFKSRFFLNPNNPLFEKIIYGFFLILFFAIIVYLAVKYTKHLVTSFFKLNTVTWSTAVLCTILIFSKIADRFPGNYRDSHETPLSTNAVEIWSLLEESSEVYLPITVFVILLQYHFLKKAK